MLNYDIYIKAHCATPSFIQCVIHRQYVQLNTSYLTQNPNRTNFVQIPRTMVSSAPLEIIIADSQPLFTDGLLHYIGQWFSHANVTISSDCLDLIHKLRSRRPGLLITEVSLPKGDLLDVLRQSKKSILPPILVISHYKDSKIVRESFKLGVLGYLHKTCTPEQLHEAMTNVLADQVFMGPGIHLSDQEEMEQNNLPENLKDYFHVRFELTRREIEILTHLKKGLTNKEIANALFISEQTVSVHRKNILRKVGVNSTQKLLHITYEHQII